MKKIFLIICLLAGMTTNAQQWGLYTLVAPSGSNIVNLVDTNGLIYKTWTFPTTAKTCFSSYLIHGDTLIRTVKYPGNVLSDGPTSGEVQKVDWNGNVVWDFIYSDSTTILHHDICQMPNGNILMIAFDVKNDSECLQAGSSVDSVGYVRYSDKIIEVRPTGPTTGTIVWQWKLWDHLCQHFDPSKDNYVSSIAANPQLFNFNHSVKLDYLHMNGIDYNAALDQITFSSRSFFEIYVIDHSTTTAEAAGHTGGNSGHGGDILYRWGNPAAYGVAGTAIFNGVHDAHWVPADNPYFPNYLCGFNNAGGVGGNSAIDVFLPPYNGYNYDLTPGTACAPSTYSWVYNANYSNHSDGSSQQLPNGNSLMCLSDNDTIIEVDYSGHILWSYKATNVTPKAYRYSNCYVRGPVASANASTTQISSGSPITLNSSATSVTETNPNYTYSWSSVPAGYTSSVQNPDLSPTSTATYIVTITNTTLGCYDTASVTVNVGNSGIIGQDNTKDAPEIYPNPTNGKVYLSEVFKGVDDLQIMCRNADGKTILNITNTSTIDFSGFPSGIYYLTIRYGNSKTMDYKVVKTK